MPTSLRSKHLENFSVKTSFRALSILRSGNETYSMYYIVANFRGENFQGENFQEENFHGLVACATNGWHAFKLCRENFCKYLKINFVKVFFLKNFPLCLFWPLTWPYSQEVVHSVSQKTGSCSIVTWVNVENRQMCWLQRFNPVSELSKGNRAALFE